MDSKKDTGANPEFPISWHQPSLEGVAVPTSDAGFFGEKEYGPIGGERGRSPEMLVCRSVTRIPSVKLSLIISNFHLSIPVSDCGGVLQATTTPQALVLPDFPEYPTTCIWNITASSGTSRINISVDDHTPLGNRGPDCWRTDFVISTGKKLFGPSSWNTGENNRINNVVTPEIWISG